MGDEGAGPVLTAGAVARRLGVAQSTLRAWHRRYGVGPDAPRPGQYRRYGPADLTRLSRMRDLIESGVLPSDAARQVSAVGEEPRVLDVLGDVLAAARQLDNARCSGLVLRAVESWGVVEAWERVCRPALAAVDPERIDCEHVLSWAISSALRRLGPGVEDAGVLLSCTEDEHHTLALEALGAALAERGVPVRLLGAAVPSAAVVQAVVSARPEVVVLWSQRGDTARADAARALVRKQVRTIIAGPGWRRCPAGAEQVHALQDAVNLLGGYRAEGV